MNQNVGGRSTNWRLLLLIPVAVILTKAAMHRRATWGSGWGPSGPAGGGYGHHGRHDSGGAESGGRDAFRLPPKIEWMLDTWHTRVHQAAEPTESPTT